MILLTETYEDFIKKYGRRPADIVFAVTKKDTLKKLYDWGNEFCPHGTLCADTSKALKHNCDICWSELSRKSRRELRCY